MSDKLKEITRYSQFSRTSVKFRSKSTNYSTLDKSGTINTSINMSKEFDSNSKYKRKSGVTLSMKLPTTVFCKNAIDMLMNGYIDEYMGRVSIDISLAVDNNDIVKLGQLIVYTADTMLAVKQLDYAVYFYNQARILYTYYVDHNKKCKSLIGLADCCSALKLYHKTQILLKKALQYAWAIGDHDHELNIYDKMSTNYFYLAMGDEQKYFHERGSIGIVEKDTSPIKAFSVDILKEDLKRVPFTFTTITSLLLSYLNLPLKSVCELDVVGGGSPIRESAIKEVKIIQAADLIEQILKRDAEFRKSITTPRYQSIEQSNIQSTYFKSKELFRRKKVKPYVHSYDITDTTQYKISLDDQVRNRTQNPPKMFNIRNKISSVLRNNDYSSEVIRQPIMLNHVVKEEQRYAKNTGIMYRKLSNIMMSYI